MAKNNIALRPSYWAAVSGGKDSLYMLKLILENQHKYPLTGVVHHELEIDYPFIKDVIDYMEAECKKYGIQFIRIKPRKTWMELYERRGFPTMKVRWCNGEYKMDCVKQHTKQMQQNGFDTIYYIGYCADETNRCEKRSRYNERYPLVEEGIVESDILEWAKDVLVFNDFYKLNRRCGCMLCPMASMKESAYLLYKYPKEYETMIELAKATERKREEELCRQFSVWTTNPKYNTEYRDKRVREKYLPELIEKIEEIYRNKSEDGDLNDAQF